LAGGLEPVRGIAAGPLSQAVVGLHNYATASLTNNETTFINHFASNYINNAWKGFYFERLQDSIMKVTRSRIRGSATLPPRSASATGMGTLALNST
jgi:hypothetical protein